MKYFCKSITKRSLINYFLLLFITCVSFCGCAIKNVESLDEGVLITKCNNLYSTKSYDEAFSYCLEAAKLGWQAAQKNTGWMYSNGKGIEQDEEHAYFWYKKAAEQGNSCAQNNLGLAYLYGEGVKQNNKKAVWWLKESASQGNLYALTMMGRLHIVGKVVPKHSVIGYAYILVASDRGHPRAIKYNDSILNKLKPSEEFLRKSKIIANKIVQEIGDEDHCNV